MTDFNPAYRGYVSYIDKSREFYLNKGFNNPYRWATHTDAPFTPLTKPLSQSRIGVVTTTALDEAGGIDRQVYAAPIEVGLNGIHTHHVFWHKTATHTDDPGTYLPLKHLLDCVEEERVGSVSARVYGVPTTHSQRQTRTEDVPEILQMAQADDVDVMLLIPL